MDESNLKKIRLEKLKKLKNLGINPYPASFHKTHTIAQSLEREGHVVKTAGKLFSFREHGNIAFADLKDETGKIQIFFQKKLLGDAFKNIKLLDIGDFIGVEGEVTRTIAREISIVPKNFTLLSKSLLPMPNEWTGLKDTETRYRQRYLDLLLNPEIRQRFNMRTKLISGIREYLDNLRFWEVETPTLQQLYGGANAKPFTTHLNALDQDVYLRIADELYLKRLIVGGYEKVYEICKDFRNEGIDNSHFPEFTMLEWYEAYADYHVMIDRAEGLVKHLANKIYGHTVLQVHDKKIDVGKNWPRIEMAQVMKDKLGLDVEKETRENLLRYAKKHFPDMQLVGEESKGQLIFAIFEHAIPKQLEQPTWVIDYPQDVSPLSKVHRSKPGWAERFEGYIGGKEIFDGWSELTDPQIQRKTWLTDEQAARIDKEEAQHIDEDFLSAMEYGMPPFGGIGVGIDRLTMLFTNTWVIKELILFPTLKREKSIKQKTTIQTLQKPEIFSISKDVKEKFPSVSVGVAIIRGVTIKEKDENLEKEKTEVLNSLQNLTREQMGEFPEIKSYRRLYKETGIDWHSRRPSPEALLRRIALKKGLYTVNTCVDAYNLVVMKNKVSVGAFDLDKIAFPSILKFAKDSDEILLLGDTEPTQYKNGEIAYFDEKGGYNIDFNYRDAQRTAVTLDTKNLYINVDGIYDITPQQVESVLKEACEIITKYCGGRIQEFGVVVKLNITNVAENKINIIPESRNIAKMTRNEAFELLNQYIKSQNLLKHCLAVEAAMKGIYRKLHERDFNQQTEEMWGITGLLHDIDYEVAHKENKLDKHGILLFEKNSNIIPEPIAHAIKAHNYTKTEVMPESDLDWAITCVDQLTGLVVSSALISQDKKLQSIDKAFVMKRFKTPSFSKKVDRETIKLCEEKLIISLEEFIEITLHAMQRIANELGL